MQYFLNLQYFFTQAEELTAAAGGPANTVEIGDASKSLGQQAGKEDMIFAELPSLEESSEHLPLLFVFANHLLTTVTFLLQESLQLFPSQGEVPSRNDPFLGNAAAAATPVAKGPNAADEVALANFPDGRGTEQVVTLSGATCFARMGKRRCKY